MSPYSLYNLLYNANNERNCLVLVKYFASTSL